LPRNVRYPFLDMPNIARLQREGVTFNNFFCVQSLSSPSRATILTGVYPHTHGVTQNLAFLEPNWERTKPFSVFLRQAGYTTAFIGKIHLASDVAHRGEKSIRPGFDYWVSFYGQGVYENPQIVDNGREVNRSGYMTDILSDYAVEWLDKKRDKSKPFMMCLWHKAVHEPFTPAAKYAKLYENQKIDPPLYGTHMDDLSDKPKYLRANISGDMVSYPDRIEPKPWNPQRSGQMGKLRCMSSVDESLGRILDLLQRQGILDNTVIMFSSDNGYLHGEHQRGDKRVAFELSMRIPMIVRYPPTVRPGSQIDALCLNLDVAPTILDMASGPLPAPVQGASLKELMAGGDDARWRKSFLYEYYFDNIQRNMIIPDLVCVRGVRYKYIDNTYLGNTDRDELYDLQRDPGEMHNIILEPTSERLLASMSEMMERLKKRYGYNPDRNWRVREIDPTFRDRWEGKN